MSAKTSHTTSKQETTTRPPIVVVLGHVDHGKSSLLEAIREDFRITAKESGGITQHIGAYQVQHQSKTITFIDTPGHEAFSAIRSRGARVADIGILVVAADEGVKPQTQEAIAQAKAAKLSLIVAINKIDKPEAQPERVKQELAQHEVFVESFGGTVPCVLTSAVTKQGIQELLEMILLVADLEHVEVNAQELGTGVVIESSLDPLRGPAATLLVEDGTLRAGSIIGTKSTFGKVRMLQDFQGGSVSEASPGMPVVVIGFQASPQVGEEFRAFLTEEAAQAYLVPTGPRQRTQQEISTEPDAKFFDIVLKADALGSLEVLESVVLALPQDRIVLRIVQSGIGEIGEGDVRLAQGTHARVFGFRTKVNASAQDLARREGIPIETFDVIYDLIQRVRTLLETKKQAVLQTVEIGSLEVLAVFLTEKNRQIVGGRVSKGEIRKKSTLKIMRQGAEVGSGRIVNLQKNKKDAERVQQGDECGVLYEGTTKIEAGDTLLFFVQELQ